MSSFQKRLESGYYDNQPKSEFWNDLEADTNRIQQENKKWSIEFNKVAEVFKKAKSLEKIDIYQAIELYESIKNTKYGNFDTVGRLAILYRKTKQKEKEIQHMEFKIEEVQNTQYDRMTFLQGRFPAESEKIKLAYDNKIEYLTPDLMTINFHSSTDKLIKTLNRLLSTENRKKQ